MEDGVKSDDDVFHLFLQKQQTKEKKKEKILT
jgi:hypothetical protein